jgi:hypothetical protein
MFKIIYPESDATLYEALPTYNTGIDEILEVGKRLSSISGSNYLKSRSLLKFDMDDVNAALTKYNINIENCKFVLQLYTTHAKNLSANYTINANLVGDDWTNGTGFQNVNVPITDGVTWNSPKSGSYFWTSGSQDVNISGSSLYISGSGKGGSWLYQSGSGIYGVTEFSQSFSNQPGLNLNESFSYRPTDLNIDVTGAVKTWISGSGGKIIPNFGFLLKFSDENESDTAVTGYVRFFSRETHTIYVPRLTMYFDKSSFTTGSLEQYNPDSYTLYTQLKKEYKDSAVSKIRIYSRDKYPQKSPTNKFPMTTVKYLPNTTLYSLKDAATDEVIIPYDSNYTKVSCDQTSNFITMDMSGLMPERYYRLEFKIVNGYMEDFIDDEFYFKIVR